MRNDQESRSGSYRYKIQLNAIFSKSSWRTADLKIKTRTKARRFPTNQRHVDRTTRSEEVKQVVKKQKNNESQ